MKNNKIKNEGFTLSEVLITLAVIGIVAALTIPTVVRNYQKTQTITRLKKAYNALANTTNLAIAAEGPIEGWEAEPGKSVEFANKYIIPYLKVAKNCGYQTTGDCAYNCTSLNGNVQNIGGNHVRFFLNDGIFIALQVYGGTNEEGITRKRAIVYVDTNGQKKPNVLGKDIFVFLYYITTTPGSSSDNGKFMPIGYGTKRTSLLGNTLVSACNKETEGMYCAALIMQDGWQIRDDYPW